MSSGAEGPLAYVVDTETTGHFEEQEQPQVIELAYGPAGANLLIGEPVHVERFKPSCKITMGAMAVHHIIPADLENCRPSEAAKLPADAAYIIGHNIDFDWKALGSPPLVKRICTLALARHFWPEEKGHSLGACLYRVTEFARAREILKYAHSAAMDVRICYEVFQYLWNEFMSDAVSWEDLWTLSENARIPRIWPFGKHRGLMIGHEFGAGRPDLGYHAWCVKQLQMDPYLKTALQRYKEGTL